MASPQLDGSALALFLLFVVSCFIFVVRGFRKPGQRKGSARPREPPSPRPLPIIGNLHELAGRRHPHRRLQALARRHGPVFLLRLGSGAPALVVSSASLAEAVLRTQDHVFCSRPEQRTARGTLYGGRDVGFSPYGDRWRQLRRIAVVHLLSARRVDSFRALRAEELSSFLQRLRAAAAAGAKAKPVDVTELIVSLTYGVISRAAFGDKLGGVEPGAVREIMAELTDLLGTIAASDVFPRLGWVVDWATGLDARVKRTAARLDDILERAFEEHERSRGVNGGGDAEAEAAAPPDLLDDLLSIVRDGDQGIKLDMVDAKGLILDMFIAGTDTTYKTVEWTMAELVKNPREMEKVQEEVRQVVGAGAQQQGSSVVVREEDLEKMSLLKAAMKEALRLHPPVPLLIPRETIQDTRLQGYDIPAKTRVMVNAWAIGRDGESWGQDAEEFRPERFLVHGQAAMADYSGKDARFIPFGAGRRGCPGVAFGTRLAELTLANMMCHFDWALPDGRDLESFEVVESTGLSPGLKHPLTLAVTPL